MAPVASAPVVCEAWLSGAEVPVADVPGKVWPVPLIAAVVDGARDTAAACEVWVCGADVAVLDPLVNVSPVPLVAPVNNAAVDWEVWLSSVDVAVLDVAANVRLAPLEVIVVETGEAVELVSEAWFC